MQSIVVQDERVGDVVVGDIMVCRTMKEVYVLNSMLHQQQHLLHGGENEKAPASAPQRVVAGERGGFSKVE